jgi:hypothetical protein
MRQLFVKGSPMQLKRDLIVALPPMETTEDASPIAEEQIMHQHGLTVDHYLRLRRRVSQLRLSDILFSHPSDPYHDIALNLILNAR